MSDLCEKHQNVLAALTLGYKEAIDPETKHIFTSSGTMHVLAVSGLHVGIVYMVISFCFGFLKFSGPGRTLFLFISLGSLWFFALLTGLSPSVSRAALMFSFVVVGQNIRRRSNIYNTLTASAFFLLIINPNNLFDAVFQFSYSAVFGIVFMQPRIEKLIDFRYRVLKYFWSLLSVSVAAQVATFPLSVYYFGQFPAYFWISNLVIIPAVTILVPVGFMLMAFCWMPALFKILTILTEKLVNVLFGFLKLIEQMPNSMIKISLSEAEIFFLYCLLLAIFLLISKKNLIYVKYILLSFFMILIVSLAMKVAAINRKEIIVYNVQGNTVIHLIAGCDNYIVSSEKVSRNNYCYRMAMRTAMKLKLKRPLFLTTEQEFKDDHICIINNLLNFEGRIICVLNKPIYLTADLQPDILISTLKKMPLHVKSMQRDVTLVTKMRIKDIFPENINVHNMDDRGAYIEKW